MKKTYVIHVSEYPFRGIPSRMYTFRGTYRELLEHLNNVTPENRDVRDLEDPEDTRSFPSDYSDSELEAFIEAADDDDGGHYHDVWCVEDGRQVLPTVGK